MANDQRLLKLNAVSPGSKLRELMEQRGWSPEELATIIGKSKWTIHSILSDRTSISVEMAGALGAAFGNSPQEWLHWDSIYRLSLAEVNTTEVERKARLYRIAPVRDMQKRGWIEPAKNADELEQELKRFFKSENLDEKEIGFPIAPRRTVLDLALSPAEKAWCYRARQLAQSIIVEPYSVYRLSGTERKLRQIAAYAKESRHVPKVLANCGIRFVVVEPIPGVKIDGTTFWLGSEPVIAVSLRHDRIDAFWFTLMHEFSHVCFGDASVDIELIDEMKGISALLLADETERRANERASGCLIPEAEMQSFIRRVGPFYQRERIIQFAHKIKIHPGIIVGQLQHKKEIGYSALRDLLVKIRHIVTSTALTDGWNQVVAPSVV